MIHESLIYFHRRSSVVIEEKGFPRIPLSLVPGLGSGWVGIPAT